MKISYHIFYQIMRSGLTKFLIFISIIFLSSKFDLVMFSVRSTAIVFDHSLNVALRSGIGLEYQLYIIDEIEIFTSKCLLSFLTPFQRDIYSGQKWILVGHIKAKWWAQKAARKWADGVLMGNNCQLVFSPLQSRIDKLKLNTMPPFKNAFLKKQNAIRRAFKWSLIQHGSP